VLAQRVERAAVTPGVEQVPLIGTLVRRVKTGGDVTPAQESLRIGKARNGLVGGEVAAGRNLRVAGITAKVHVHFARPRLEPDEADEVATVAADGLAVGVASADPGVQRVGHPGRAIDGRVNPIRERLPPGSPRRRTGPRGRLRNSLSVVRRAAARAEKRRQQQQEQRDDPRDGPFIARCRRWDSNPHEVSPTGF
jgi:hypothetical protein